MSSAPCPGDLLNDILDSLPGDHRRGGFDSMADRNDSPTSDPRKRRRRRHSSRSRRRSARETESRQPRAAQTNHEYAEAVEQVDESLLTRDERTYLEARRAAEHKVSLYREAVKLALIVVPLLVFIPFVGVLVLIFGGMKLGRKFYSVMVEPGLRRRIIHEEVSKRVQVSVQQERGELEGEHARSLEELSASIAHEIRNPITAAKSLVQQMEEEPSDPDNVEYARVALGELQRVEKSISHLLKFARDEDVRMRSVRMVDVLDSALETFRDRHARAGVEIVRQFDTPGQMLGDADKLRRIFINLVGNAIDAMEQAGTPSPTIEISMGENLAGTEVWVRIVDNGPGIDDEVTQKIFSPFFTSKEGGTGLGLAITKKLVEAHNGTIELQSEPGSGTEFVVTFPKLSEAS